MTGHSCRMSQQLWAGASDGCASVRPEPVGFSEPAVSAFRCVGHFPLGFKLACVFIRVVFLCNSKTSAVVYRTVSNGFQV